jgi:LEA14-like dessication related protein
MRRRSRTLRSLRRAGIGVAAAVLAAALAGCATFGAGSEPIEVQLVSLTPLPSTAFEHRLRVDLRLRNPNNRSYEIDGLRFLLDVNGERLASGLSSERATLPRLGEVVVPVTTTTSLLDLVNQIVVLGNQQQPHFAYALRGKVFLKGAWGSIPFERSGSDADLIPRGAPNAPAAPTTPPGRR